uniref:nucleotidyltransferase family protein n=1 Tax=uncultured Clostridium sp. TaxID=59620 RepID=UPI0025DE6A4B
MLTNVEFNLDKKIVEEIYEIASKYKSIRKILLFGSRARKDNSPKSDIDFMIVLNRKVGLDFFGLYHFLSEEFDKNVDVIT